MKIQLLRNARITYAAGEIIDVSPKEAERLIYLDSAKAVEAEPPKEKKKK